MTQFLLAAGHLGWPAIALIFAAVGAWECYTGTAHFGRYFEFDRDDSTSMFIIVVGLKFVAAILIVITMYSF
jgi:hypothetical protein